MRNGALVDRDGVEELWKLWRDSLVRKATFLFHASNLHFLKNLRSLSGKFPESQCVRMKNKLPNSFAISPPLPKCFSIAFF